MNQRDSFGNIIRTCEFCGDEPGSPIITPNDEVVACLPCAAMCVEVCRRKLKALSWKGVTNGRDSNG